MNRKQLISTIVASLLIGTLSLSANSELASSHQNTQKVLRIHNSVNQEVKIQKENFKKASKEISDGLKNTFLATKALENKKVDEAKKLLNESIKLFETALKSEPKLGLISIAQEISLNVFEGNAKELQHYIDSTIALLRKHDTQKARAMIFPLEDEMVISTQRIPIDLYLASTKDALKLLDANKKDEALSTLIGGITLMELDTVVMPIPLMLSEDLIIEASLLDTSKKDEAQKLLALAQDELKKAVLFGYTKKHELEYQVLSKGISEIQKEIKGKNVVEKLYDKLKNSFHSLITTHREDVVKQKAQKEVHAYQNKEAQKAINETSVFKSDSLKDEGKMLNK
jgi:ribosomal protein L22